MDNVEPDNPFKCPPMFSAVFKFLFLVALVLLIVNFSHSLTGDNNFLGFESFLNWLGTVKPALSNFSINSFTIGGNWGVIDGLRNFINIFANALGILVFMSINLINMIVFLCQFAVYLLGF